MTVNNKKATVLFLDLEKAFELANPAAILETLVEKGAKGRLLHWIKNNVLRRRGRVKFQGVISDYKQLHNGMLQGGILSLFLFNVLMENIAKLALPRNAKIFIFVHDITVVVTRNNQLIDAQEALNIIEREFRRLGLKINPSKTKAMAIKDVDLGGHLTLEQQRIEWARHHQCLGIWIKSKLSFHKQVEYLRERTSARLAPMKHITSLSDGANYHETEDFLCTCNKSHNRIQLSHIGKSHGNTDSQSRGSSKQCLTVNIGSTNVDKVMQFTDGMKHSPTVLKNKGLKRSHYSEDAKSTEGCAFR